MAGKIKSEIIRIDLTDASYKDSHAFIEPTFINFFFGNNGAGKSTIAKAIKSVQARPMSPEERWKITCHWFITRILLMKTSVAIAI